MKEKILNTAIELFLDFGFKSVTMDDIAQKLGISKKTIYSIFPTKSKLVEFVTLHVFETIDNGISCICSSSENAIEEFYSIKSLVFKHLKNEKSSPQYQLQKYYPKIYSSIKIKHFESVQNCTLNNIQKGIEQGLYRADIDPEFVSRIYFIGGTGIKDFEIFPQENYSLTYLADCLLEHHIRAIATPKGIKILENLLQK